VSSRQTTFTTSDLSRRSGDVITAATKGPVTITQRSKPRWVLLSFETYEEMRRQERQPSSPRIAGTLQTMPDEIFEVFKAGVADYKKDDGE